MIDKRIEFAILQFEDACHRSEHELCGGSRTCVSALTALGEVRGLLIARRASMQAVMF